MNLTDKFVLFSYEINTIALFVIAGIFCWLFVLWVEARKDGFLDKKILDLGFSSVTIFGISFYLLNSYITHLQIYSPASLFLDYEPFLTLIIVPFLLSLSPVLVLSRKWSWSAFRLFDIYAVAYSALILLISIGMVAIYSQNIYWALITLSIVLNRLILRYRGYKLVSGTIFSIFVVSIVLFGLVFYRPQGYLLFYAILITIALGVAYFRIKKIMKFNINFPKQFLDNITKNLKIKEKELKSEQKHLIKEDPYLQPGRTVGNSEILDEVTLEDQEKELTDQRLGAISIMRLEVRKALAKIKIGKYGICENCGDPIDKARLKIYPEAKYCIDCARDQG